MSEIEEKLKLEISNLENQLKEKDLKIARLEGYNEGAEKGFNLAKKMVLEKIHNLPQVKNDQLSIMMFFTSLTQVIKDIKEMDIVNIRHGNN